jgi:hypothetical protein
VDTRTRSLDPHHAASLVVQGLRGLQLEATATADVGARLKDSIISFGAVASLTGSNDIGGRILGKE